MRSDLDKKLIAFGSGCIVIGITGLIITFGIMIAKAGIIAVCIYAFFLLTLVGLLTWTTIEE